MSTNKLPEINAKQIGANLNIDIEGQKKTVKGSKEELAPIKTAISTYKSKPTKKLLEAIDKMINPVATKAKEVKEKKVEQVKAEIKSTKKKAKTVGKGDQNKKKLVTEIKERLEKGTVSQAEINELEVLIQRQKEKVVATVPTTTKSPRRGEY